MENNLLKAVSKDLEINSYIAGCRALGLIDKYVTGPFWRLLSKIRNVASLNTFYQDIEKLCKQISLDATEFLQGKVTFFNEFEEDLINRDKIFESLMEPNDELDELTKQILEIIFLGFPLLLNECCQTI